MTYGRNEGSRLRTQVKLNAVELTNVESVRVTRGRQSENEQAQAGRASVQFRNKDGLYTPGVRPDIAVTEFYAPVNRPGVSLEVRASDVGSTIEALRPDRYFPLNEQSGTVAVDRGVRTGTRASVAADGTYTGSTWGSGPSWTTGPHVLEPDNEAAVFPGTEHYVTTGGTVPFRTSFELPRTYIVWIKRDAGQGGYVLSVEKQIRLWISSTGAVRVDLWAGQSPADTWLDFEWFATPLSANEWHMLALVATDNDAWRLFVDGQFRIGAQGLNPMSQNDEPLMIGGYDPVADPGGTFQGAIKDLAVWYDAELSPTQIERLWTMSSEGTPIFDGYVDSWTESFPDGGGTPGLVTLEGMDGAYVLGKQDVDMTPRGFTTKLSPTMYFTFDDDRLQDLQGGPSAQFLEGSAAIQRRPEDPVEVRRISGSLSSGVSQGALYLNESVSQMSQVLLPFPSDRRAPTAAMCWFKAAAADIEGGPGGTPGRLVLLYSRKENGANWDHWFLGVNAAGVVFTRKETRSSSLYNGGSLVSSSEAFGTTYVCNDTWHHIAFLGSTVVVDGVVEPAASGTFVLPGASIYRIFGGTYVQYGIDELAIWYDGTVTAADLEPIYRSASDQWEGQTAKERVEFLLDLVGWDTNARDLSDLMLSRLGPLQSGSVWQLCQEAAAAEAGVFDFDGAGNARLRGRQDRRRMGKYWSTIDSPAIATDLTGGNVGGYDNFEVITDDRLLYTAAKIDDVYYEDADAIAVYGRRVLSLSPRVSSNEAAARAKGYIDRYRIFAPRSDTLTFQMPSAYGAVGLILDVSDLVTAGRTVTDPDTSQLELELYPSHVEYVEWTFDGRSKRASVNVQLSPVDVLQDRYWTIGKSTLTAPPVGDVLGW